MDDDELMNVAGDRILETIKIESLKGLQGVALEKLVSGRHVLVISTNGVGKLTIADCFWRGDMM